MLIHCTTAEHVTCSSSVCYSIGVQPRSKSRGALRLVLHRGPLCEELSRCCARHAVVSRSTALGDTCEPQGCQASPPAVCTAMSWQGPGSMGSAGGAEASAKADGLRAPVLLEPEEPDEWWAAMMGSVAR